ncbi:MAG: DUF4438 domain-containing protein [Anaerolineae bacterium]
MRPKTNEEHLVKMAVTGNVSQPGLRYPGYIPNTQGTATILPGMAGIVYNARVGDPAFGWSADHLEPGVSIANPDNDAEFALHYLTCIGNRATIMSGLASGATGVVTGEHARLLIDFEVDALDLLCIDDAIQIEAYGRGLQFVDFPEIELKKCSPQLINAMPIEQLSDHKIRVPVAIELPPRIMGSGAELNSEYVDQDLMSGDKALMAELGIDQMKLGDLIVIPDADHRYGRGYRTGAVTIALCIHGDSVMIGHGPGILALMSCPTSMIEWEITPEANIANYLNIRNDL